MSGHATAPAGGGSGGRREVRLRGGRAEPVRDASRHSRGYWARPRSSRGQTWATTFPAEFSEAVFARRASDQTSRPKSVWSTATRRGTTAATGRTARVAKLPPPYGSRTKTGHPRGRQPLKAAESGAGPRPTRTAGAWSPGGRASGRRPPGRRSHLRRHPDRRCPPARAWVTSARRQGVE